MNDLTTDWVASHADRTPDRTALVDPDAGRQLSYEAFDRRASRVASCLRDEFGLEPGDRVGVLAHNRAAFVETVYGCAKAETPYVALNWRLSPAELAHVVEDSDPDVLVYDDAFSDALEALRDEHGHEVDGVAIGEPSRPDDRTYEGAIQATSGERRTMAPRSGEEVWGYLYTSGTTGRPKGVPQTFDMVLYNHLNVGTPTDLTSEDVTLNVLPCFHTGGLNLYTNPTLLAGGTAIVPRSFDPEQALELLETRVTAFFGVPAMYRALTEHPGFEEADLSGVRSWAVGGAPMSPGLTEAYAERGVAIRQGMGMTETGPTLFLVDEERAVEKADSVGKPAPFVDARVVDGDGNERTPNESGELLVRGPGITPGYLNRPEATEAAFVDGWFRTEDVARVDDEGYYYLVDRVDNMFISGGENVYPAEIERVLEDHPGVAEAAVVAVPDERWGEVGKAVVAPSSDRASLSAEGLLERCGERLAGYKVPKHVAFVDELPRNAAGKVEREQLADGER